VPPKMEKRGSGYETKRYIAHSPTCSSTRAGSHNIGAIPLKDRLPCVTGAGDDDPLDDIGISTAHVYKQKQKVIHTCGNKSLL
jgi:hypothetical protein